MKHTLFVSAALLIVTVAAPTPARAQFPNTYPWDDSPMRRFVLPWTFYAGHGLNSATLNSTLPDGGQVTSVSLDGVTHGGKTVKKVWLQGSRFGGLLPKKLVAGPNAFTGAVFTASVDDGSTLALRVNRVFRGKDKSIRDIFYYEVSYQDQAGWQPFCGVDDQGDPVPAIPLRGAWSYKQGEAGGGSRLSTPRVFTFACVGHVLAKCVEGGYRPWLARKICKKAKGCLLVSLAGHHQACTRLLRADFCGDGTPHTVEDTLVNMYDVLGLRTDTRSWTFEGEWNVNGAVCAKAVRVAGTQPKCMAQLQDSACGDPANFKQGSLLFSEIPPTD